MHWIDTHAHLYLDAFDADRKEMIARSIENGVIKMLLPNIDTDSIIPMLELCRQFPENCFPMIGLHPTSVKEDYKTQLSVMESLLNEEKFVAIGEIGIDLYWDKTFINEQKDAFKTQLRWAKQKNLPVAIHTREAFPLIIDLVEEEAGEGLTGVFHCFSGNYDEAKRIIDLGFLLGIGGVLTYKKSHLPEVIREIPIEFLVLETDAPFLPPVPYRGKRNESAYIPLVGQKIAEIKEMKIQEIARITTENAERLFKIVMAENQI
jgi:TatD DNase family protein